MTQEELAEKENTAPQTTILCKTVKKELHPETENIIRICSALEVNTDYLLLGEVNSRDHSALSSKISDLSPAQYRHLEDIINSFLAALGEKGTQGR